MELINTSDKKRQAAIKRYNPNENAPAAQKLANQCWGGFRKPAGEKSLTLYFNTAPALLLFGDTFDREEFFYVDDNGRLPNSWVIRLKLDLGRKKFVLWLREEITNNGVTKQYPKYLVDYWKATCGNSAWEFKFFSKEEEEKLIID